MKKGVWIVLGIVLGGVLVVSLCCGIGLLGIGGVMALTQPIATASDEFFTLLGQDKVADAYASTASGYRAQQNEASFAAAVKKLGLTNSASSSWTNRNIKNQEGSVEGTVTTRDGAHVPVAVRLIHEDGKWKVVGVRWNGVELTTIREMP